MVIKTNQISYSTLALASTADGGLPGFAASMYVISAKDSNLGNAIKDEVMNGVGKE